MSRGLHRKYRIMMVMGLLFLNPLVQAEKIPETTLVDTSSHQFILPIGLMKASTEVEERTPWGRANVKVYSVTDEHGVTFIFRSFNFLLKRQLESAKLKQVRSSFLQQRKCVAKDVAATLWFDDEAHAWPQTLFDGYCAAPENFMVLTALIDGHLYQVQVISKGFASDKTASQSLMQSMKWFVTNTQLMADK